MAKVVTFSVKDRHREDLDWIRKKMEEGDFKSRGELFHYLISLGRREDNNPNHLSHEIAKINRKIESLEEKKSELKERIREYHKRKEKERKREKEKERKRKEEERKRRRELVEKVESEPDLAEKLRETGDPEKVVDEFREEGVRIGTLELSEYLEIKGKKG